MQSAIHDVCVVGGVGSCWAPLGIFIGQRREKSGVV